MGIAAGVAVDDMPVAARIITTAATDVKIGTRRVIDMVVGEVEGVIGVGEIVLPRRTGITGGEGKEAPVHSMTNPRGACRMTKG